VLLRSEAGEAGVSEVLLERAEQGAEIWCNWCMLGAVEGRLLDDKHSSMLSCK